MIIGVTGTNGAGKGTVVEYLVTKGFKHYSVRDELVKEITDRGLPIDRSSMRLMGNEMRQKHGPEYPNPFFLAHAKENGHENILIESIRNVSAAKHIKEHGGLIFAVDADRHIRYERVVLRGSHTDKVDFDTWVHEEEREWHNEAAHDMNVPGVMKLADATFHNDGTLEELHAQIDKALATLK